MARVLLSPEEYEFFSVPLRHEAGWNERLPLRRVSPDASLFFRYLPVQFFAVVCSAPEQISAALAALSQNRDAGEEVMFFVPRTLPPGSAKACLDLHPVPDSMLSLHTLEGLSSGARLVEVVDAAALTPEMVERYAHFMGGIERSRNLRLCLLICGTPALLVMAAVLASFSSLVIDGAVYSDHIGHDARSLLDTHDGPPDLLGTFQNYHRLQQKSRVLEDLFVQLAEPVVIGEVDGSIIGANDAFVRLTGVQPHELLVHSLTDLVCDDYRTVLENVLESLEVTGRNQELQVELRTAAAQCISARLCLMPHQENGQTLFYTALFQPGVQQLSVHSPDLSARQKFVNRLDFALQRASRQRDYAFAVLVMGIDALDQLLEKLSPEESSEFFKLLIKRVGGGLRNLDMPSHLDPEHFSILLDDVTDVIGAVRVAQRIQEETRKPFRLSTTEVLITCSFGVVLAPFAYENPEEILRDAQTALERAQQRGERQTVVFDDRQNNRAMQFLRIESELRSALANEDVCMYYQPVIGFDTSTMCGIEAFMRWERKRQGLVRAEYFLPFAEHSDLMFELEAWTIRQTCRTLSRMQEECGRHVFLGLNVSLKNLLRLGFLDELLSAVHDCDLEPSSLLLEVREAWLPQLAERFPVLLRQVQDSGMGVVLDHFHAGRTSLLDLHHLPLRGVKIAPSLLDDAPVVSSLVAVAKSARLHIHVPGLERGDQVDIFRGLGCDFGQGDAIAPAMDEESILQFARKNACSL